MVFDCFISDQTTVERHPQILEHEAFFHSNSLFNFCRASRGFRDIGVRFLYRSVCIRNGRNPTHFDRALEKKPAHARRLHYTNGPSHPYGSHDAGHSSAHDLDISMRILPQLKGLRLISLCMPHDELRLLSCWLSSLATEKQWPSLEAFIFQSYGDSRDMNTILGMAWIKLPNLVQALTFCFNGLQNICLPPRIPFSLPKASNISTWRVSR